MYASQSAVERRGDVDLDTARINTPQRFEGSERKGEKRRAPMIWHTHKRSGEQPKISDRPGERAKPERTRYRRVVPSLIPCAPAATVSVYIRQVSLWLLVWVKKI